MENSKYLTFGELVGLGDLKSDLFLVHATWGSRKTLSIFPRRFHVIEIPKGLTLRENGRVTKPLRHSRVADIFSTPATRDVTTHCFDSRECSAVHSPCPPAGPVLLLSALPLSPFPISEVHFGSSDVCIVHTDILRGSKSLGGRRGFHPELGRVKRFLWVSCPSLLPGGYWDLKAQGQRKASVSRRRGTDVLQIRCSCFKAGARKGCAFQQSTDR